MTPLERCQNWNERWSVGIMVEVSTPGKEAAFTVTLSPAWVDDAGVAKIGIRADDSRAIVVDLARVQLDLSPYKGPKFKKEWTQ